MPIQTSIYIQTCCRKPPCVMAGRLAAGHGRFALVLWRCIVALEGASAARLWFLMRMRCYRKQVRSTVRMSAAFVMSDKVVWFLQTWWTSPWSLPITCLFGPSRWEPFRDQYYTKSGRTFLSYTFICTFTVCLYVILFIDCVLCCNRV